CRKNLQDFNARPTFQPIGKSDIEAAPDAVRESVYRLLSTPRLADLPNGISGGDSRLSAPFSVSIRIFSGRCPCGGRAAHVPHLRLSSRSIRKGLQMQFNRRKSILSRIE